MKQTTKDVLNRMTNKNHFASLHFYSGKPKFIKGGTILALPHTEAPYTLSNFILSGKVEVSITLRAVTEEEVWVTAEET